jgi:hypothetical protein
VLRKGTVSSVIFYHDEKKYTARISEDEIILFREDACDNAAFIAEHERKTGKTLWSIGHCCGTSGFGRGIDDVCYACNTDGQKMEATPKNKSKLAVYGGYTPELAKIIPGEVLGYCKKLEGQLIGMKDS